MNIFSDPNFFLSSSDGTSFEEPRKCYILDSFKGENGDTFLLVQIDPPYIEQHFGKEEKKITKVLLAPRHVQTDLLSIKNWPVFVHIALILSANPRTGTVLHSKDIQPLAWGELYETEEKARNKSVV